MGVLAPLVVQAQPAIFDGGVRAGGTEGRDWEWRFVDVIDPETGDLLDLTGIAGECKVWERVGGTTVATLTITGADGEFTISATAATTAGLAAGVTENGRSCVWGCFLSDGSDKVQVWGPSTSDFKILQEA